MNQKKELYKKNNDYELEFYDKKNHKFSIANNIDYKNCIEFYKSKDNSKLKEYLETQQQEGAISKEELEFWEGAIEIGTVQDICRTAVIEYHEEDRKNDPAHIKIARAILKSDKYIDEEQKAQKQSNRELFNGVYMVGYTLKEIITQKMKNKDRTFEDIVDNIDYEEMEQKQNALYNKMQEIVQKLRDFSKNDTKKAAYTAWDYYKGKFLVKNYEIVSEYDEIQMQQYIKEFENKPYDIKSMISTYNNEKIINSDLNEEKQIIENIINNKGVENTKEGEELEQ